MRFALLLSLAVFLPAWADPRAEARGKIETLIRKLASETADLEAERGKIQAHLRSCEGFLATLDPIKDAEAATVARTAVDKDRASLAKTVTSLDGLNRRLGISRDALDNLSQGRNADLRALVQDLEGPVQMIPGGQGKAVPLRPDLPLRPGDRVVTRKGESATLLFADGSKVRVGEGTSFALERDDPEGFLARLESGKARFQVERLFQRRFSVRTTTCAVAVRGTSFTLESDGKDGDVLTVHEGEVEVEGRIRVRRAAEGEEAP